MRILQVHNFYQQPGGEDEVFAGECRLLQSRGHHLGQFVRHNDAMKGIGLVRSLQVAIWNPVTVRELRALLRREPAEIVHFHNTVPLISPSAYYAARAEGAAVVQTLHNFRQSCVNALLFRKGGVCVDCVGKNPWRGVMRACYRGSIAASAGAAATLTVHRALGTYNKTVDLYIALTDSGRVKFIQAGLPADKIVIKPNFVHPDPGVGEGRAGYAVFVGRLSAEKGLRTLLKAWETLSHGVPLKIVGDGPDADLVRQAASMNPNIVWLGQRPMDEVLATIGDAAFLVFPSEWYETFGRVAAEAFAKGTPVIASNLGAMAELVEHGRTGLLFRPGDPGDLAATVEAFQAFTPEQRAAMRREARGEFEAKYTADRNYKILMEIYQLAIDRVAQRGRARMSARGVLSG